MKTVMVLGAGRGQIGLIKAARELGHRTVVVSIEGDYPGFAMADEIIYADISDPDKVAEIACKVQPDAVITAGTDFVLPSLGEACERSGCPGPSRKAAEAASNKALMKEAFRKGGVSTARHIIAYTKEDAAGAADKLRMPVVVKATDLQGSVGINIVFNKEDLEDAFEASMKVTHKDHVVIEEYIDGYEVSATALVTGGEIAFILPTGDVRYGENGEKPVGHYVPLDCDEDICSQIREQIRLGVQALGLDNCAVNSDLMVMDGKVYILELTCRLGGNAIPEITSAYYGRDIYKFIIEMSLGQKEQILSYDFSDRDDRVCYAQMLITDRDGYLVRDTLDDPDCDARFFMKAGDFVSHYRDPHDCIGQVAVVHSTKKECEEHVARILKSLEIRY